MKAFLLLSFALLGSCLYGQNLIVEAFSDWNRTKYNHADFANNSRYFGYGTRLGLGAEKIQIGGEYRSNLNNPSFLFKDSRWTFDERFVGGFVRTKFSRYPAMRFGLVIRAGIGVYNTTATYDSLDYQIKADYDPILGFNGSIGISMPIFKYSKTMFELAYTLNYAPRPELFLAKERSTIPAHNGSSHLISLGLSYNLVFGKQAERYEIARQNWKYRKGW